MLSPEPSLLHLNTLNSSSLSSQQRGSSPQINFMGVGLDPWGGLEKCFSLGKYFINLLLGHLSEWGSKFLHIIRNTYRKSTWIVPPTLQASSGIPGTQSHSFKNIGQRDRSFVDNKNSYRLCERGS